MGKVKLFTRNDYTKLLEAERQIADLIPTLDDLQACDFDCHEYKTLLLEQQERLGKIKQRFFTPPPRS